MKVALVQSSLFWEDKTRNRTQFEKKINDLGSKVDLIILPEMFTTGFSMNTEELAESTDGNTVSWLKDLSSQNKVVIVGSIIVKEKDRFYNRLVWVQPNGQVLTYDKRHLFRMAQEDKYFSAGQSRLITSLGAWRFCPMICYDLRFPVFSRNIALEEDPGSNAEINGSIDPVYDCLIYIANWPEARNAAWKALLVARAIENQSYVIAVNRVGEGAGISYSGDSMVIDAKGNILSSIAQHEETCEIIDLNLADLEEFRKKFPVNLDADRVALIN